LLSFCFSVCLHYHDLLSFPTRRSSDLIFAHLATMFMLAGHYTVYAYFTPFLERTLDLEASWISVFYFLFGIAAVAGGVIGGGLATRIGSKKSILIILGSFSL